MKNNELFARLKGLLKDDDGAVTVDWVALVAVTILLGIGAAFTVGTSVPDLANSLSEWVAERPVGS